MTTAKNHRGPSAGAAKAGDLRLDGPHLPAVPRPAYAARAGLTLAPWSSVPKGQDREMASSPMRARQRRGS